MPKLTKPYILKLAGFHGCQRGTVKCIACVNTHNQVVLSYYPLVNGEVDLKTAAHPGYVIYTPAKVLSYAQGYARQMLEDARREKSVAMAMKFNGWIAKEKR